MAFGYKVCIKFDGKWCSYRDLYRKYYFDRPTKRINGDGPLAVFDNYEAAILFHRKSGVDDCRIFKIKYKKSKDSSLWRKGMNTMNHFVLLPPGTDFADEVILLEDYTVKR